MPGNVRALMTDSWDTIADWYAELLRSGSAIHDFGRNILLDYLPTVLAGQRVLDLGCGEESSPALWPPAGHQYSVSTRHHG